MTHQSHPSPIFVLTLHRSGGTVLARVLNCHPDLVLWGEHAGLINQLAQMDEIVNRVDMLRDPKSPERIADFINFPDHRLNKFEPWVNPFDYDAFCRSCRDMIEGIFTRGLREGQRWGFKEIRYHRVATVRFLQKLFPDARFIILRRDVKDVAISSILASSSLGFLKKYQEAMPPSVAEAIVNDVTYAILAVDHGFNQIQAHLGEKCRTLFYRQLLDPKLDPVMQLFAFCGLALSDEVVARIRKVLEVRSGGTNRQVTFGGILSRDFIREHVTRIAPELAARIARDGIDRNRLTAEEGIGQYSFMIGDHHMREHGGGISTVF